jgi:hypothetical protein
MHRIILCGVLAVAALGLLAAEKAEATFFWGRPVVGVSYYSAPAYYSYPAYYGGYYGSPYYGGYATPAYYGGYYSSPYYGGYYSYRSYYSPYGYGYYSRGFYGPSAGFHFRWR